MPQSNPDKFKAVRFQRANFGYQSSPLATTTISFSNFLPDSEFSTQPFPGRPALAKFVDLATSVSREEPGNESLESFSELQAVESDSTRLAMRPFEDSLSEENDIALITLVSASTSTSYENEKMFTLTDEDMSLRLCPDLGKIPKLYSVEFNANHDGNAIQDVTIEKMVIGICRF